MMRLLLFLLCFITFTATGQESSASWQTATLGSPQLNIQLPGTPTPQVNKLPPAVREKVKVYQSSYLKNKVEGLVVTLMYAEYSPDIESDAKGALDGTNGQWETTGAKVSVIATQDIKVSGRNAVKQHGKLIMGSEDHDFTDIVIVQANKLWQVIIMTKANDSSLQAMNRKIATSLSF
jgi:hypothetical protein